jgi:hypothetical protein
MSAQEQTTRIGEMVVEQSDARRRRALHGHEIEKTAEKLTQLGAFLARANDLTMRTDAYALLREVMDSGGLERLKSVLGEYDSLSAKIHQISSRLEEADILPH